MYAEKLLSYEQAPYEYFRNERNNIGITAERGGLMIYGVILAGGIGSRMGNKEKPKQYISIGGKPVILHTVEKFCMCSEFEEILILCPADWIEYTKNLIKKHVSDTERIAVLEGGATRNETIMNSISYIEETGNLDEETVIVTHDAVRPFVTYRILKENIEAAQLYGACDTVIPATDTIVESRNGSIISAVPDRAVLYQGQTPQSFRAAKLKKLYEGLTEEEKNILTDAAKIFVIRGEDVHLVKGENSNIKITYPYDLTVAESLLQTKGE